MWTWMHVLACAAAGAADGDDAGGTACRAVVELSADTTGLACWESPAAAAECCPDAFAFVGFRDEADGTRRVVCLEPP